MKQWRITHCIYSHVFMSLHSSLMENTSLQLFCGGRRCVSRLWCFGSVWGSCGTSHDVCGSDGSDAGSAFLVWGAHKGGWCLPVASHQEAVMSICPVSGIRHVPFKIRESHNTAALETCGAVCSGMFTFVLLVAWAVPLPHTFNSELSWVLNAYLRMILCFWYPLWVGPNPQGLILDPFDLPIMSICAYECFLFQ